MTVESLITSLSYSSSSTMAENTSLISFIFLSPCPQRLLLASIDSIFIFIVFIFAIQNRYSKYTSRNNGDGLTINEPLVAKKPVFVKVNLWFYLSLSVSVVLAALATVASVLGFKQQIPEIQWKLVDGICWLVKAISFVIITFLIVHEKKFHSVTHPVTLRVFLVANFVAISLISFSSINRLVYNSPLSAIEDIISSISLLFSGFFLVASITGSTGITVTPDSKLDELTKSSNVTPWASASILSKLLWLWLNPLLKKGYKTPLISDDIPTLSQEHQAETMSLLFEQNWPKSEESSKHPVQTTLIRCFLKDIAFTGLLTIVKLGAGYVGPLLIQRFVDFTSGKSTSPYEGYYLVLVLLVAKLIEVLSSQHFSFESKKLGMKIRSSLITSLYKKGLRLSCSARQAHGVGQIVNYMAVDAQQVAGIIPLLHSLWLMPIQVGAALVILYLYLGTSTVVTLILVVVILSVMFVCTKKNNQNQFKIMMSRDSRLKATNEMLSYMRVIKFQAWEEHFNERIQSFRESEYGWLCRFSYSIGGTMVLLWSTPLFMSTMTFGCVVLLGLPLDAGMVFTATSMFRNLQDPIYSFPQSMISLSQAMISLGRLDGYMSSKELDEGLIERDENGDGETTIAIKVQNGSFSWNDDPAKEVLIKNLNFELKKGKLAAIVGTVGSGKSSLLASVVGEMNKISGKVKVFGNTAYVAQTAWIQNATIQENIMFGSPMDPHKYKNVIRACCLEKDLEMMESGDQTEIGERGINLSGGQKQRVQLARAVYQDSDIYLLDDVFSAVDAHTGSDIFKECIRGILRYKTVLLVTHQVDFLHNVDLILVMRDGMIVQSGKYDELVESGLDFKALVSAHETSMELVQTESTKPETLPISSSVYEKQKSLQRSQSQTQSNSVTTSKLIKDEERETGRVTLHIYKAYLTEALGWSGLALVLFLSILWQATQMSGDYWLAYETSEDRAASFRPSLFIGVYAVIGGTAVFILIARITSAMYIGLVTAQKFFKQILQSMIHAPMSFFDTTPSGRILTRASSDQANVDMLLPFMMQMTLVLYISVIGVIVITCQYAWPVVFLLIPLGLVNVWYQRYYIASSREITRLDSITKAPVIHHFSESISRVMTIRCFRKQDKFVQDNVDRVNGNLRMEFHNSGSSGWLGFRSEFIGTLFLCVSTAFMILLPSSVIKPENIGLSLSYGLSLNGLLFAAIISTCSIENQMVSVERINQFTKIPSEAEWVKKDSAPPPNWPDHGSVELRNLQVRYRPDTPLVLKGITLNIQGGQKIGVVGRTGGGKSSLIQVLFRLVEPSAGSIIIDGIDICTLGLHDLRSRFGIIPQEPILFKGTVRSNIDPIRQHSDEEIWRSLERCQLRDVVSAKPGKLDSEVVTDGDNWSVGQRQLLCLGRVLLKQSKLLFMDEATASVDSQTDAVIQKIIREDFADSTIVSIAHRIPTVMDCDMVLVIDGGYAKEFDRPSRLLDRPSLFGALVQEYSKRAAYVEEINVTPNEST